MNLRELLILKTAFGGGGGSLVEKTATGNPVAFTTKLAKPLNSITVPLSYTQEGSGDPSPSNIRPISGVSSLSAYRTGINIFDEVFEEGTLNASTGQDVPSSANIRSKNYISVVPRKKYYIKYNSLAPWTNMRLFYYGADKSYKSNSWSGYGAVTIPADVHYVRFYMDTTYTASGDRKVSINYPYTETGYVPYSGGVKLDVTFPALGKNLFNAGFSRKSVDYQTGVTGSSTTRITSDFVELAPNTYTFSLKESKQLTVYFYTQPITDSHYFVLSERISTWQSTPLTFTTTEKRYALFVLRNSDNSTILTTDVSEVMLNTGESASAYEPYNNFVYGGSLDLVSGVLTITNAIRTFNGSEEWSGLSDAVVSRGVKWDEVRTSSTIAVRVNACNWLKPSQLSGSNNMETYEIRNTTEQRNIRVVVSESALTINEFRAVLSANPFTVVCPLATPITIQLDPHSITAIKGNNTVWTDTTGDLTIKYYDKA